jgi:hypothetical protein
LTFDICDWHLVGGLLFNRKSFTMRWRVSANQNMREIIRTSSKLCFPINNQSIWIP